MPDDEGACLQPIENEEQKDSAAGPQKHPDRVIAYPKGCCPGFRVWTLTAFKGQRGKDEEEILTFNKDCGNNKIKYDKFIALLKDKGYTLTKKQDDYLKRDLSLAITFTDRTNWEVMAWVPHGNILYACFKVAPDGEGRPEVPSAEECSRERNVPEIFKGVATMILWDILCIVAATTRGKALSVASALIGVQLGYVAKFVADLDEEMLLVEFFTMVPTSVLGGLILAAASSKQQNRDQEIVIIAFAVIQVVLGIVTSLMWSDLSSVEAVLGERAKAMMETVKTRKRNLLMKLRLQNLQGGRGGLEKAGLSEDSRQKAVLWSRWFRELLAGTVLVLAGTCVPSRGDMTMKLSLLAVGLVTYLKILQTIAAKEEKFASRPAFEFAFLCGKLAAEILPIAHELMLDDGEDNPKLLTALAWSSLAVVVVVKLAWRHAVLQVSGPNSEEGGEAARAESPQEGVQVSADVALEIGEGVGAAVSTHVWQGDADPGGAGDGVSADCGSGDESEAARGVPGATRNRRRG